MSRVTNTSSLIIVIRNDVRQGPSKVYEMKNYMAHHLQFNVGYLQPTTHHIVPAQLNYYKRVHPPQDSNIHNRRTWIAVTTVDKGRICFGGLLRIILLLVGCTSVVCHQQSAKRRVGKKLGGWILAELREIRVS